MPPPWKMMGAQSSGSGDSGTTQAAPSSAPSDQSSGPSNWMKKMINPGSAPAKSEGSSFGSSGFVNGGSGNSSSGSGAQVKISFWPSVATEDDLRSLFAAAGEITRARMLPPRDGRDITLCFVTFSSNEEAEAAVREFSNHEIEGRRLRVEMDDNSGGRGSGPRQDRQGSSSGGSSELRGSQVKIYAWPASMTEDDLRGLFSPAGEITRVRVLPARDGRDNTLAFVTYSSDAEADSATKQFNGHEIDGQRLKVQIDEKTATSSAPREPQQSSFNGGSSDSQGDQVKILMCPAEASEDDIRELFSAAGGINRVKVLPAREGRDITLGFVTFNSDSEAAAAVQQFDGFEFMGKRLKVSVSEQGGNQRQGRSDDNSSGAAKPWNGGGTDSGSAKPWGGAQNDSSSSGGAKPWGSSGGSGFSNGGSGFSNGGSSSNGYSGQAAVPYDEKPKRFDREERDGGIFIEEGEMNQDFSMNAGRAPVIYIPPPPPEGESEIFNDTCHEGINFQKYENIPVEVTGREPTTKLDTFEEANLHQACYNNIKRAKYDRPTPVQKHVLPAVLSGRDVMACAQTGSGKTAAYLLPVISTLLKNGVTEADSCECATPNALIIAPTRELAIQIFLEARKFAYGSSLRTVVVYGGVAVSHQVGKLCDGCNVLVATPGRLNDFIGRGRVSLSSIQYLILDEADRMLDMGFGPTIQGIVEGESMAEKGKRQTLMLSATFPEPIQVLAGNYLNDYLFITVGRVGGASSDIVQKIIEIPGSEKRAKLEEILLESGGDRILVFVETKRSADFLASFLSQRSFPTTSISSDRSQEERECALRDFRTGKAPVLIATAVAARGLDIPDVKHVINFDLPAEVDEYVHRIGRTGRIGNQGKATGFFDRMKDPKLARGLVKVLSESTQEVPEWLEEIAMSAVGTGYGPGGGQFQSRDRRENNRGGQRSGYGGGGQRSDRGSSSNGPSNPQAAPTRSAAPPQQAASNGGGGDDDMWC